MVVGRDGTKVDAHADRSGVVHFRLEVFKGVRDVLKQTNYSPFFLHSENGNFRFSEFFSLEEDDFPVG
jgi:hypothetical protein